MNTYQTTRSELSNVLRTYQQALDAIVAHIPEEQHDVTQKRTAYDLDANEQGTPPTEATIIRMYRPVATPDEVSVWKTVRDDILVARNACVALASSYVHRFSNYIQSHTQHRRSDILGALQRLPIQEYAAFPDVHLVSSNEVSLHKARIRIIPDDYGSGMQSIPISYSGASSVFHVLAKQSKVKSYSNKHYSTTAATLYSAFHIVLMQLIGIEVPRVVSKRRDEKKETPWSTYMHASDSACALRWV